MSSVAKITAGDDPERTFGNLIRQLTLIGSFNT